MDRRTFVKGGAALGGAALAAGAVAGCSDGEGEPAAAPSSTTGAGAGSGRQPNIVVLLTDQQRHPTHWPAGLIEQLQPSLIRLARRGLTFTSAFTSASQCTPSRGVLWTGTYPWMNGVTNTSPPGPLQTFQSNLVRLLEHAGYDVAYKGKWHLSSPAAGTDWSELDIENMALRYGIPSWNPPDAGTSVTEVSTAGGGTPANDSRIVRGTTPGLEGQTPGWGESVLDHLARVSRQDRPFALFVSLVNPHDIVLYPRYVDAAGYQRADYEGLGVDLPPNLDDPLDTKPGVQAAFKALFNQVEPIDTDAVRSGFVNFYAYLHGVVEPQVTAVLDALDEHGLTDDTIVFRFADHGEQALSHGLIEKMYSAYEETIHVPLVISDPRRFTEPATTDAFWSHVDLLPTIAELVGVPTSVTKGMDLAGRSLVPVLDDPDASVQDSVLFTYDDRYGAATPGTVVDGTPEPSMPADQPPHIRTLRERRWKYSVYFTEDGSALQYEMYDLVADPLEMTNLAWEPTTGDAEVRAERERLHGKLTDRLSATSTLPLGFPWPERSGPASA